MSGLKIALFALAIVFVLGMGTCVVCVGVAGHAASRAVTEAEEAGMPPFTQSRGKSACMPSDFEISKVTYTSARGHPRINGVVQHSCPEATAVQLKWTAYNADGTIAFSKDFWPAGTSNIQPGAPYPFTFGTSPPEGARYDVAPINTRVR